MLQLAESLVTKGHPHANSIKSWVSAVDKRYKDFASRMEKYRIRLETTLGLTEEVSLERIGTKTDDEPERLRQQFVNG